MRVATAAAALAATVLLPAAGSARRAPAVHAEPLRATFDRAHFLTRYTFAVTPSSKVRRVRYDWRLTPPEQDASCNVLLVQRQTRAGGTWKGHASWLHGDGDGCHHDVMDGDGHPGYVLAVATIETGADGTWECIATIRGTVTATSRYAPACHRKG